MLDINMNTSINSQFLVFSKVKDTGKTEGWDVLSKRSNAILGYISWYAPWRQYCFSPSARTVFNAACLKDISSCIKGLMDERRGK